MKTAYSINNMDNWKGQKYMETPLKKKSAAGRFIYDNLNGIDPRKIWNQNILMAQMLS